MRLRSLATAAALGAALATPSLADYGHDAYSPVTISPMTFGSSMGGAAADGSGGVYVTYDFGSVAVYVQHLTSSGAIYAGWPAGGIRVATTSGNQQSPRVASDGAGGAIVVWTDYRGGTGDIYATRLQASGALAAAWPANGILVSTGGFSSTKDDLQPSLISDGANGAFVVWTLNYDVGDNDVYGAHVTGAGAVPWSGAIYSPFGVQDRPQLVSDNSGGFWLGFEDNENGSIWKAKVVRVPSNGSATFTPKLIGTGAGQNEFTICSDGSSGVYAVQSDRGPVTFTSLVGNHYRGDGTNDPNWGGYKFIVSIANISQGSPMVVPDGAGGFVLAFNDTRYGPSDLFVLRFTAPYWLPAAGWPTTGLDVMSGGGSHFPIAILPDGTGGALIEVYDNRIADYFIYATRVMGNGSVAPGWMYNGTPVELGGFSDVAGSYSNAGLASDGNGGMLVAWADQRGAAQFSPYAGIYAQNLDQFGTCGDARPKITRIADVPLDQGGEVSLQWSASYLDALPNRTVAQYSIWRRVPGGTAAFPAGAARAGSTAAPTAVRPGENGAPRVAAATLAAAAAAHEPALITGALGNQVVFWEYVGIEPARQLAGYSSVVATTSDSMTAGNPRMSLMVMAESPGATAFWQSAPDSGYSVDNIPPYPPAPFRGTYSAGQASLSWSPVVVPDLSNYRLYRGTSAGFTPTPGNRVASPVDTIFTDAAGAPYYYRLSAVDIHGNESATTLLLPVGALAVEGGTLPTEVAFAPPTPNPTSGLATMRYALPREANVRLAVFDINGRRVRTLLEGVHAAGEHTATWDLRDETGRAVTAGLYFARFEAAGRTITRRVMVVR